MCPSCTYLSECVSIDYPPSGTSGRHLYSTQDERVLLRTILLNARDPEFHIQSDFPNAYFTFDQLQKKHAVQRGQRGVVRHSLLNADRTIVRLQQRRTTSARLMQVMARGNIPRASSLIARELRRGASTEHILEMMIAYQNGEWKPASYSDEELERCYVVACYGGRRALKAIQSLGGASRMTLRRHSFGGQLSKFIVSPGPHERYGWIMLTNMIRQVFSQPLQQSGASAKRLWVLMIDDTALEERVRVHPLFKWLLGICQHAPPHIIETFADIEQAKDLLVDHGVVIDPLDCFCLPSRPCTCEGSGHMSREATVIALAPIAKDNNQPRVVSVTGTCKKDWNANKASEQITDVISHYYDDDRGFVEQGPISNVSSDGASQFVKAMSDYEDHECTGWLLVLLLPLLLFDLMVGLHDIIFNCDVKHAFKRFRTRIKGNKGIKIRNHTFVGKNDWTPFLLASGTLQSEINNMFDVLDEQNVPQLTLTLCEFAKLKDLKRYDDYDWTKLATPTDEGWLRARISEVSVFGELCSCMHNHLVRHDWNVSEHLTNLATMSFLLFAIFRECDTAFIAAQNYHNLQSVIKAKFMSVAKCLHFQINEYFIFLDSDDRLENFFGHLRALAGVGRNFDLLQLEERVTILCRLMWIYSRHPDWDPGSRRLNISLDHWNTRSWTGDTQTVSVNLTVCWDGGMQRAKLILTPVFGAIDFEDIATRAAGGRNTGRQTTMYRPCGEFVGVSEAS